MGLHHRKLESNADCEILCYGIQSCSSKKKCDDCLKTCHNSNYTLPSIPTPPIYTQLNDNNDDKHNKIPTYFIILVAIAATAFFVLCCYAIYSKFFSPWNRSRRRILSQQQEENDDDEFLDEEHGPIVDHPIWYIRTTGLNESIITAITVCKYKKDEGLIEGTDCSVCLSEFEEDESLRLLPKCNHAFHLPCIDTWLRSHTNCPMCRAPIVTNPSRILPSTNMEPNVVVVVDSSTSIENSNMESNGESGLENSGDDDVMSNNGAEAEEEGQVEVEDGRRVGSNNNNMQPRRSVSLDSSSAAKINSALANATSRELCNGNSKRVGSGNENLESVVKGSSSSSYSSRTRCLKSAPGSMKRSRSYNGKHILLSRYSRSQKKPNNAPQVRSF